jgi:hypothetical protein
LATDSFELKDSGERQAFDTGAVRDTQTGKGRFDLMSPIALRRVAEVYRKGAEKYAERNWEKGMPISRCLDSALRHLNQYREGLRDEDHLGQAAWNVMAAIHYEEMIARGLLSEDLYDLPNYVDKKNLNPHQADQSSDPLQNVTNFLTTLKTTFGQIHDGTVEPEHSVAAKASMPARQTQNARNISQGIATPSSCVNTVGWMKSSASRIARKLTGMSATPKSA